jgi:hypothetical protein
MDRRYRSKTGSAPRTFGGSNSNCCLNVGRQLRQLHQSAEPTAAHVSQFGEFPVRLRRSVREERLKAMGQRATKRLIRGVRFLSFASPPLLMTRKPKLHFRDGFESGASLCPALPPGTCDSG